MAEAGGIMMSKDEYIDAYVRLRLEVRELIARHDRRAKHTGFKQCGCEDCKPFREIIEKVNHAV